MALTPFTNPVGALLNTVGAFGGPEAIVLNELVNVFNQIKCDNVSSILKGLSNGAWRIIYILVIQYCVRNPQEFFVWFQYLIRLIAYKKKIYSVAETCKDSFVKGKILTGVVEGKNANVFPPVYCTDQGGEFILEYVPFIHSSYLSQIETEGEAMFDEYSTNVSKTVFSIYEGQNFTICKEKRIFPSKNCLGLAAKIVGFFVAAEATKMFYAKGFLIDGEPGLGKTEALNYLVSAGICDEAIKIDMTNRFTEKFSKIVEHLTKVKGDTGKRIIILFDEIDKWLDQFIKNEYTTAVAVARSAAGKTASDPSPIDFDRFSLDTKESFLYELLHLIEPDKFRGGVIFLFCSNNFDSIYEGVNMTHFHSLRTRFVRIHFNRCQTDEFKDYLRFLNDSLKGTNLYNERIEDILPQLGNINYTFRDISHIIMEACFDIETIIQLTKDRHSELSTPTTPDVKKKSPEIVPIKPSLKSRPNTIPLDMTASSSSDVRISPVVRDTTSGITRHVVCSKCERTPCACHRVKCPQCERIKCICYNMCEICNDIIKNCTKCCHCEHHCIKDCECVLCPHELATNSACTELCDCDYCHECFCKSLTTRVTQYKRVLCHECKENYCDICDKTECGHTAMCEDCNEKGHYTRDCRKSMIRQIQAKLEACDAEPIKFNQCQIVLEMGELLMTPKGQKFMSINDRFKNVIKAKYNEAKIVSELSGNPMFAERFKPIKIFVDSL